LAKTWPQGELLPEKPPALQYLVSVHGAVGTSTPFWVAARAVYQRRIMKPLETALN